MPSMICPRRVNNSSNDHTILAFLLTCKYVNDFVVIFFALIPVGLGTEMMTGYTFQPIVYHHFSWPFFGLKLKDTQKNLQQLTKDNQSTIDRRDGIFRPSEYLSTFFHISTSVWLDGLQVANLCDFHMNFCDYQKNHPNCPLLCCFGGPAPVLATYSNYWTGSTSGILGL